MTAVKIINLHPSRWREIKALRLEALQTDSTAFGSSYEEEIAFEDTIWHTRAKSAFIKDKNLTLYAELENKLVGMMGASWSNRIKTGHIANIYGVFVTSDVRGQGVGSQLLQAVLDDIALIPQIKKLMLGVGTHRLPALALYEKFGFQRIGIANKELKIDGYYYDEYLMEKLL